MCPEKNAVLRPLNLTEFCARKTVCFVFSYKQTITQIMYRIKTQNVCLTL